MTAEVDRIKSPLLLGAAWVVTRLLMLTLLVPFGSMIGDVRYYWGKLSALPTVGISSTMTEYPSPVVWFMQLLAAIAGNNSAFAVLFAGLMLLLDAALTVVLYLYAPRRVAGTLAWIVFAPLMGLLCIYRFDMVPAVLVAAALVLHHRRPALAGGLIATGAAIKLWPALLILPLLFDRERRKPTGTGFAVVGGLLGLSSLALTGWRRSVSPLTWQSERGLQIESLPATPLMVARYMDGSQLHVAFSAFNAFEVFGPGVSTALVVGKVLTAVGMLAIAALIVRGFRHQEQHESAPATVVLAIVAIMIVTNKTLSPQYILWLLAPVAAGLGISAELGGTRRRAKTITIASIVIAITTFLVYPAFYDALWHDDATGLVAAAGIVSLTVRNLLLAALTVALVVWAWRVTSLRDEEVRRTRGAQDSSQSS